MISIETLPFKVYLSLSWDRLISLLILLALFTVTRMLEIKRKLQSDSIFVAE
jgi:hypothetical protein